MNYNFNIETLCQSQGKPLFLLIVWYIENEIVFAKHPLITLSDSILISLADIDLAELSFPNSVSYWFWILI